MIPPRWNEQAYRPLLDTFNERLSCVQAVSFDVFDTTLQRVVYPKEVFALVEETAVKQFGTGLQGFADCRIMAEQKARHRSRKEAGHGEVDLEAIYAELLRSHPRWAQQLNALLELEVATEERCARAHPLGWMLWQLAIRRGRTVCFISDMYLGSQRIESLLRSVGYSSPLVLCSSDHACNKGSGKLFAVAAERLQLNPEDILHIGDHPKSDQAQARLCGLQTLAFPAAPEPPREAKHFRRVSRQTNAAAVCAGLVRLKEGAETGSGEREEGSGEPKSDRIGYGIGYSVLGPLAYGLCSWLIDRLESDETDLLLCLGRDGHLPYQILKRWQVNYGCLPNTKIVYTRSSRRATALALAADGVTPLVRTTLGRHRRSVPLRIYFERIGLDPAAHLQSARAAGFESMEQIVHRKNDRPKMEQLVSSLEEPLRRIGAPEKAGLLQVLSSQGLDEASNPAIFDLGWRGTQQACLQQIVRRFPKLRGYYLSISEPFPQPGTTTGYLVDAGKPTYLRVLLEAATPVVELLFSSPEPTLLHYQSQAQGPVPIFDRTNPNAAAIESLQSGALDFVEDMTTFHNGSVAPLPVKSAMQTFTQMAVAPVVDQLAFLSKLAFSDALGKESSAPLVDKAPPPLSTYLFNYPHFFEAYAATCWRARFISQMSLPAKCWVWFRSPSFRRIWRALRQTARAS